MASASPAGVSNRRDDYSRDPCDRRLQNEEPVQSTVSTAFGWTQNPLL